MTVKERLKNYLKYKEISATEFGRTIGVSSAYISSMVKSVPPDKLERITLHYPDLNTEWLMTGNGEMLKKAPVMEAVPLVNPQVFAVPLISKYAYAGYMRGYGDQEYVDSLPTVPFILPEEQTARGEYVAIEVRGDSMDNGTDESLKDGDILLCRRIHKSLWASYKLHIKKWNFVIMCNEGIVVKRIVDHNLAEHTITIHSLNDMYQDEVISLAEVREIFNVVQMMRKPVL